MIRRGLVRASAAALAVAGAALLAWGSYIPAKAAMAQVLLQRAWARARHGQHRPRPWPWADTYPIARLTAPRLGVVVIVLEGTSGRSLAFGPGHLVGSAAAGAAGTCAVAGHRDTHFAFLKRLRRGDALTLEPAKGRPRRYRVVELGVMDRDALAPLPMEGPSRLVLITCYPFDGVVPRTARRYVVVALEQPEVPGVEPALRLAARLAP